MTIEQQHNIAGIGGAFIAIALAPILAVCLRQIRPEASRRWRGPFIISITISWLAQNIYRTLIELPINMEVARGKGDLMYDGVGGNVATAFLNELW